MSAAKLSKQLQRELKANPQKAGALGLLCLVAAYFWGPLIFKGDDSKKTVPTGIAPPAPTVAVASPTPEPTAPTVVGKQRLDWRTLSSRLKSDPSMRSVAGETNPDVAARSPFDAPVKHEKVEPIDDDLADLLEEAYIAGLLDEKPTITKQMTSTALNAFPLRLSSTLVGTRARTAVINGRAFAQGSPIGKLNEVELVLEYVDPRSAVIAWNGMRRELRIPKPGEQPPVELPDEDDLKTNDDAAASRDSSDTETSGEAAEYLLERARRSQSSTN